MITVTLTFPLFNTRSLYVTYSLAPPSSSSSFFHTFRRKTCYLYGLLVLVDTTIHARLFDVIGNMAMFVLLYRVRRSSCDICKNFDGRNLLEEIRGRNRNILNTKPRRVESQLSSRCIARTKVRCRLWSVYFPLCFRLSVSLFRGRERHQFRCHSSIKRKG